MSVMRRSPRASTPLATEARQRNSLRWQADRMPSMLLLSLPNHTEEPFDISHARRRLLALPPGLTKEGLRRARSTERVLSEAACKRSVVAAVAVDATGSTGLSGETSALRDCQPADREKVGAACQLGSHSAMALQWFLLPEDALQKSKASPAPGALAEARRCCLTTDLCLTEELARQLALANFDRTAVATALDCRRQAKMVAGARWRKALHAPRVTHCWLQSPELVVGKWQRPDL
mmetsp:Transcript_19114/g.33978  ORF Transcript_19114/g.33978 Transcript_19114/m.33978 type:complete len:235 (-) Transcript_19114:219-923(-)